MTTFNHPTFRSEVDRLLSLADVVIVGTDHHTPITADADDVRAEMERFFMHADLTMREKHPRPRIFFASTHDTPFYAAQMEAALASGVTIIDLAELHDAFRDTHTCTKVEICFGRDEMHPGAIGYGYWGGSTMALSSLYVQAILASVCDNV